MSQKVPKNAKNVLYSPYRKHEPTWYVAPIPLQALYALHAMQALHALHALQALQLYPWLYRQPRLLPRLAQVKAHHVLEAHGHRLVTPSPRKAILGIHLAWVLHLAQLGHLVQGGVARAQGTQARVHVGESLGVVLHTEDQRVDATSQALNITYYISGHI